MSSRLSWWLGGLILLAAMAGCATAPVVTEMTPSLAPLAGRPSGKTLQVMPLKEGVTLETSISKYGTKVENFQEAMLRALKQTGLFKEVFTSQEGDYVLQPALISFDVHGGFSTSVNLFINYRVTEQKSGREVWKENIFSQGSAGMGEGLYKGAYEGAVRSNLSQLAEKLSRLGL